MSKALQKGWMLLLLLGITVIRIHAQNTHDDKKAKATVAYVQQEARLVDQLSASDVTRLPVGIVQPAGNQDIIIAVDSARITAQGAFFSAYTAIAFPGSGQEIAFVAKDVSFSPGGISLSSGTKLMLASAQTIQLSEKLWLELPADGRNYVEWDCNGFKAVNLKGNFIFSRSLLEPDNELLAADPNAKVKASFEVNTKDLNNILARVDISPFKISGLNDLSFEVKQAVVDMSDIINPEGFSFPKDYQNVYGESINLWRGFYLKELNIKLPAQFAGSKGRPSIQAANVLIDDAGLSGLFSVNNILTDGSMDGWPFTVNRLSLQLLQNKVAGGGMSGALNIPFLGADTLSYTADIFQDDKGLNYAFAISIDQQKEYNMPFGGTLKLDKGCMVKVHKVNDQFVASALLNGSINVNQASAVIKDIKFEQLELVTKKPYVTKGTFSIAGSGQSSMANFPISLEEIKLGIYDGQLALGMNVTAGFMNQSDKGFSGSTRLLFIAKAEEEINIVGKSQYKKQRWKFDRLQIEDIAVNCNIGSFGLKGLLRIFDNDAVYGKGFRGNLELSLPVLPQPVKAAGYFGSKTDFRYWQVNIFAPTGKIPIAPPLFIDGIMGGMSYHMVRQQGEFKPDFSAMNKEVVPKNNNNDTAVAPRDSRGEFIFLPEKSAGLGFMAGVTLLVAQEKVVNGDALLEVAFREGGGLKYTQFSGGAYFFTALKDRTRKLSKESDVLNAPAYAHLKMLYDNDNKTFHANLKAYLNAYNAIKGVGPNGMVGEAVIHVDPKDWYVYIGKPSQMLGVEVLRLARAQGYFMIGTQIEPMPDPPSEVSSIIGNMDKGLMRDETSMAMGKGFGVGARMDVGFSAPKKDGGCFQKKFPFPFYASFSAGGGADIMLRNYGDAHCKGSNEKIGINGWYASGQAYMYLSGKIGIALKKCKRHFDIVSLGAAAILQAKLPNPSAFKGALAANYRILGGLIKGRVNLKFAIGDECEIVQPGNELGDIKVIADVQPTDGGTAVSVFAAPQATFNIPIDQEFEMMNNEDVNQTYRIRLDDFSMYKASQKIANTNIEWNASKDVAILNARDILPPSSQLKVNLKLHFEKLVNNKWVPVLEDGHVDEEVRTLSFTTGEAPDFIPEENVAFSYPANHQYNFYKNEYKKGYIKLKRGQPYLFNTQDNLGSYKFTSRLKQVDGTIIEQPVLYNAAETTVQFDIPESLKNNSIYQFSVVRTPLQGQSINRNVKQQQKKLDVGEDAELELNTKELTSAIAMNVERDLYNSDFRVSNYNTFVEKMNAVTNAEDLFDIANGNVAVIGKRLTADETFDKFELTGNGGSVIPLVTAEASKENKWLNNINFPLLYQLYPSDNDVVIGWRDTKELGVMPLKAVKLRNDQNPDGYLLNKSQVENGFAPANGGRMIVGYYLSYYVSRDFMELRNKAAAKYLSSNYDALPEGIKRILTVQGYTDLLEDTYKIKLNYTLPGMSNANTSKELSIQF